MEHISLSAELGEIRYAIEGAHWIADSVAMGAVPDPERTNSAPVIISAILLLVENRLHQLGRVRRGEENPAHLLTPHNATTREDADRDDVVLRAWDWSRASRLSPSEKKETEQPRPVAGHLTAHPSGGNGDPARAGRAPAGSHATGAVKKSGRESRSPLHQHPPWCSRSRPGGVAGVGLSGISSSAAPPPEVPGHVSW